MECIMELYNTLTQKKEPFVPHTPGQVKMYTCGPTVYHYAHIGNLRTYIMEDVLEKFLRYEGNQVDRVMNITDVGHLSSDADTGEDKMLAGARRTGISPCLLRNAFLHLPVKGVFSRWPLLSDAGWDGYFFPSTRVPLLYALPPHL